MPRRRRRIGSFPRVERKERAFVWTNIRCDKAARKILETALRTAAWKGRTTCQDIVVECGKEPFKLTVRADCTSPKTREAFEAMAEGYAESVGQMFK